MEEHCKSLGLQYDLFVNNTLKHLDTATERDYMLKLKVIDQLSYRINQSETDKDIIKKNLEAVQDECSKLTYKLKTSARLLDEIQVEKGKLEFEKETMKSQLEQLYGVLKKQDTVEKSHNSLLNHSECVQLEEKKTFNNTDALLSDISYSHSEDSSYENVLRHPKHNSEPIKKCSTSNILKNLNTKQCEIKNVDTSNTHIVATTVLTMDLGCVNAKSVIKTYPTQTSKVELISLSSDSTEPMSTSESETENNVTEKKHNLIQKIIVIPEICDHCQKKIKFNNYMVKCLDCNIITHLECKDFIPAICVIDQLKINALNCGVPPSIVHCISEIERRGLDTVGLYRGSGSNKGVKILRDKFSKSLPNLSKIDVHVLCSYLKDLIRVQENNLISQNDLSKLTDALKNNDVSKSLGQVISEMPRNNRNILAFLILHLQKVASSPKCNMDFNCLAIVFGPTIVGVTSTSLDDLHIKSEIIFKVIIELLKQPYDFWFSFLKTKSISSDEPLYSTPIKNQPLTPGSANRFFSSGLVFFKRCIPVNWRVDKLYRRAGSNKEVKSLRGKFCESLPNFNNIDVNELCNYLKDLICTQEINVIPPSDFLKLTNALKNKNDVSKSLCQVVSELPHTNRNILTFVILQLQTVATSPTCNMDYKCLAIDFGPIIVGVTSTSFDGLHIKSEIIFKVILELLKLPYDFWLSFLKTKCICSDNLLTNTPIKNQPQTPESSNRFFSTGMKRFSIKKKNKEFQIKHLIGKKS